ncbi:MAG: cytochrome b561 CybB [Rhodobacteraceae bacterium HLUCCA08]|nr:MAG: cytochrome b561 CybB [Rhodobacteraceae bacterium HLUCCA08]
MTRHARPVILLHWVTALLIVLALVAGKFMLEPLANDDPAKLGALRNHAILGLVLLGLMLARVVVRLSTKAPPPASTGHAALDVLSKVVHVALYALVFVMIASGIALALQAGLRAAVASGDVALLPDSFHDYTPRRVHGLVATLLIATILAHILGAVYHQRVLKDGIMRRMSLRG